MNEFTKLLREKKETIVEQWTLLVREDENISTANTLPYPEIRDTLPNIIEAIASRLDPLKKGEETNLLLSAWKHGYLRSQQGYAPQEIAREYGLVREMMILAIEEELERAKPQEIIRVIRLIDKAMDDVIVHCFRSYTEERLRELQELQTQLNFTNQELTRLVRANKENFADLAHELKTPLNSIIGYSELFLRQQRKQSSEVANSLPNMEHIERVLRNGRQLLQLINNSLEISRYEAGKMPLHLRETSVKNLIYKTVEMVETTAREKQLNLEVDCDQAPEIIVTDPLRLQQVVTNLLSNAVCYTHEGTVRIECRIISEQEWKIVISDTGVGIDEKDQAEIFTPYFQVVSGDHTFLPNSTGLGLAIVSRLIKLLQGNIQVFSEVNVGSTFTVTFPLDIQPL
ncbi:sensor histidine kinase [Phormidium pseudopriestleyi FRX01]|uniref:histidine kinase n=1 Tax=Phormidium pseudopriestleyi FRX01 TaxID=1759528 RepID=A0ABS3FP30_9CYAN|nr:sensor histidine kinase [Phormidium pseudopriestleyi]MBO0348845.1 sensor histidine kinase [Phormidium pseudopriestleyi FRX01]